MAASHDGNLGSVDSGMNATTASFTAGQAVSVGDVIIVTIMCSNTTPTFTVADDASGGGAANVYTEVLRQNGQDPQIYLFKCDVTRALTTADSITSTASAKTQWGMTAEDFSGLTTTEDGVNSGSGSSTTPSSGSITPANAVDVVLGIVGWSDDASVKTEDTDTAGGAGWTTLTNVVSGGAEGEPAYKITTSAVSQTYDPTLADSRRWCCGIAAFEEDAGGGGGTILPFMMAYHGG